MDSNDNKPRLSVIIPTYNRGGFVTEAIDSVLAQTYTDYEIIVVDDGSIDNTREVLQPYLSKINYIYQANKGVSAARNTGIRVARGEWIAFLDSDDEWQPCKLELQMKDFQQFPDAVLGCTNILIEGPSGTNPVDYFRVCLNLDLNRTELIREPILKTYAVTSTVLARRDAIFAVGMFDEHLSIYEDIDLFYRLSTQGGFIVNPSVLAKLFRRNESEGINLSAQFLNDKEKNYNSIIKIYQKLSNYKLSTVQQLFVKERLSSSWFDLGIVHQNLKNSKLARHYFLTSFQAYPSSKNLIKLLFGLSGQLGVNYIESRRKAKKGFRRSEYFQNGTNQ